MNSQIENNPNNELEDDEEFVEYDDLTTEEVLQEVRDELAIQSELFEKLVELNTRRLQQETEVNDKLTRILDKLASN